MGRPRKIRGVCSVPGCGLVERSVGLCVRHYMTARRKRLSPKLDVNPSLWSEGDVREIAGRLDQAGHFRAKWQEAAKGNGGWRICIRLQCYNPETPARLQEAFGMGNTYGPYANRNTRFRKTWQWTVTRKQHVQALCTAILPWMCKKRQEEIAQVLYSIENPKDHDP